MLNLFGIGPKVDFAEIVKNGAIIVDVRTPQEFKTGNIKGSINIPVQGMRKNIGKLKGKENHTVITCCASGMRSSTAKGILIAKGFKEVHNGGGWMSLDSKI